MNFCLLKTSTKSFAYNMHNKGPSLDPCGTKLFTENPLDLLLFKTTLKYRLIKKSVIHPYSFPSIPYDSNLDINLLCDIESNALEKSIVITSILFFSST